MISFRYLAIFLVAVAFQLSTFAASASADYSILFVRKSVIGERYVMTVHAAQEQSMTRSVRGRVQPAESDTVAADFVAAGEVLALSATGRESKVRLVVEKLTRTESGRVIEVLPAGTELLAERKGDKVDYLVGGRPVTPLVANTLQLAGIELSSEDSASDDQIFGTQERKKPGDSWPVNAALAAADMAKKDLKFSPDNLTGRTTFLEVVNIGGQESLRLQGALVIRDIQLPLPPGLAVTSSEMKFTYSGLFPIDPSKRLNRAAMSMESKVISAGKMGDTDVGVTIEMKQSKETVYTVK